MCRIPVSPALRSTLAVGVVIPLVLLSASCASYRNRNTAVRYAKRGDAALATNNLLLAHEQYRLALVNVQLADLGPTVEVSARYHLARASGLLCQHQEAERLLQKSLKDLEALESSARTSAYRSQCIFALANLAYDRGLYRDAASYFGRAVPIADELNGENTHPMIYAEILDRYADALGHTGQRTTAAKIATRAANMRRDHPDATPARGRLRYDNFNNAREQLLADLRRAEAAEGSKGPTVTSRLLWLGVLESNRGNHEPAVGFFERGFSNVEDAATEDAAMEDTATGGESMAIVLDRYAHVLRASRRDTEAHAIEAKAAALRRN